MYVIYMDLSMLTDQTSLPPNQPTGLKLKNLHNFEIFQPIWLKLSIESLNGRTQHMHTISCQTSLPPNQPTSLKMKNVHNFAIFKTICLKLGMETQNGRTPHMYVIYMHLSMLTGLTGLPSNQPTCLKVKNVHNFSIF